MLRACRFESCHRYSCLSGGNWQTRCAQDAVPSGVRVQIPPQIPILDLLLVEADEVIVPTFELETTATNVPEVVPSSVRSAQRSNLDRLRDELDGYFATMQKFEALDPVEVMFLISAMSARVAELRSHMVRQESRSANAFRTKELEPFLEECERQFKIHSRIQSMRDMEFRMSGGQV